MALYQEEIPVDILNLIISFLQDKEKRNLRLASTIWFELVNYNKFCLYLTKPSEWKQIVDRLLTYKTPISLRLRKNIMTNPYDILDHLTRLTNITGITIAGRSGRDWCF